MMFLPRRLRGIFLEKAKQKLPLPRIEECEEQKKTLPQKEK